MFFNDQIMQNYQLNFLRYEVSSILQRHIGFLIRIMTIILWFGHVTTSECLVQVKIIFFPQKIDY